MTDVGVRIDARNDQVHFLFEIAEQGDGNTIRGCAIRTIRGRAISEQGFALLTDLTRRLNMGRISMEQKTLYTGLGKL